MMTKGSMKLSFSDSVVTDGLLSPFFKIIFQLGEKRPHSINNFSVPVYTNEQENQSNKNL